MSNLLKGLKERYEAWREWHRAEDELYALDDRSLADIGITRSDIPYILSKEPVPNRTPINDRDARRAA
jgi:uncharacterized protein YjiS (DUF1127 family)